MSTTTVSDARRDFADLCNRVAYGRERVIIERHGKASWRSSPTRTSR